MTIIELVTNFYFLYSIIWILLGLWIIERWPFQDSIGRIFTVIFSPIMLIFIIVIKVFKITL